MSIGVIIPARLNSTRLENKTLLAETGYPLIWHTWKNLAATLRREKMDVWIATDSNEIRAAVSQFCPDCPNVIMTGPCNSGTERVIEANRTLKYDYIINVQGDYPCVSPYLITQIRDNMFGSGQIFSAYYKENQAVEILNPARVKIAVSGLTNSKNALYFSRSPIPHEAEEYSIHVGVYGYSRETLNKIAHFSSASSFKSEGLEQLSWLENGLTIKLFETKKTLGIDTREDYDIFKQRIIGR